MPIKGPAHYPWMKLSITEAFVPLAKKRGAAKVARSYRGFYTAFQKAKGQPTRMGDVHPDTPGNRSYAWWQRRNEFITRHMAQVQKRREELWDANGDPTNRHLGLIMWAYTPDPDGVLGWVQEQRNSPHRARRNTGVWKPKWEYLPVDLVRREQWKLHYPDMKIAVVPERDRTVTLMFTGMSAGMADAVDAASVKQGVYKVSRRTYPSRGMSSVIFESFSSVEEAQTAAEDLLLLSVPFMPEKLARATVARLRHFEPEALVRMDQLLSGAKTNPIAELQKGSRTPYKKMRFDVPFDRRAAFEKRAAVAWSESGVVSPFTKVYSWYALGSGKHWVGAMIFEVTNGMDKDRFVDVAMTLQSGQSWGPAERKVLRWFKSPDDEEDEMTGSGHLGFIRFAYESLKDRIKSYQWLADNHGYTFLLYLTGSDAKRQRAYAFIQRLGFQLSGDGCTYFLMIEPP